MVVSIPEATEWGCPVKLYREKTQPTQQQPPPPFILKLNSTSWQHKLYRKENKHLEEEFVACDQEEFNIYLIHTQRSRLENNIFRWENSNNKNMYKPASTDSGLKWCNRCHKSDSSPFDLIHTWRPCHSEWSYWGPGCPVKPPRTRWRRWAQLPKRTPGLLQSHIASLGTEPAEGETHLSSTPIQTDKDCRLVHHIHTHLISCPLTYSAA